MFFQEPLCTGTKCEKQVLFGFGTGTKSKKLNFYSSIILNSPLIPTLYPKITTFSPFVPVLSPKEIEEKNSKNDFWVFATVQIPYFCT